MGSPLVANQISLDNADTPPHTHLYPLYLSVCLNGFNVRQHYGYEDDRSHFRATLTNGLGFTEPTLP